MGVVIKQSFWGTVISYVGVLIGYINTLYLRAEYFDLSQIGLFTLITANAMIFSTISSFGMNSTFVKYFGAFNDADKHRFFSFLFLVTILGNITILTAGFFFKDLIAARYIESSPTYIDYISITAIIIVANSLFDLFFSYSRTILKVVFPSFLRDVYLRIGALLLVVGYATGWWSFPTAVVGLGVIYFSSCVFLFIQLVLRHGFKFNFSFGIISREWRMKLLKFGSYSMVLTGSFALINNVSYDQITALLGLDMNGIYTTCFFIAIIVETPRRNMGKVISPIISREIERGNIDEVGKLYKRSSITMTIIGMLLFIGIATNLTDLFNFIPKGDSFRLGFHVVVTICLTKLILMSSSFAGEIINFSPQYKFNLVFQLLSATILIVLNGFLIPIFGINGAAISYFFAILFHIFLKLTYVKHLYGIFPYMTTHLTLLFIGLATGISAFYFQPGFHPVLNIFARAIFTTFGFLFLIYRFRISPDINKIIHSTFERFLKLKLPK